VSDNTLEAVGVWLPTFSFDFNNQSSNLTKTNLSLLRWMLTMLNVGCAVFVFGIVHVSC